ncbi:ABC transporter substrate-binding protein [Streptomyces europaeiscabiei]|uniref:Extracellular solute-binding protein n=1 Tax=Streptomyces europaeiscabiei TaxID=146819 RepID=A0ABU4NY17_9ACTN|nr:extracellular solute-binding protein [Streptomyces europaeiscabiei]MDX2524705.1 extracellular solute-binding protein [Streptomyces europaeiscabiei]MDX2759961.1 extracellular solute-binding protein [Streptomyces europaeiscabiei]MDX3548376.1 extracellular solute-binding protein [Streptomyces europaeiscabiei]MDX3559205.1 extracellular solute-binding protein [Streptomyces europaeiscabiei]MDX3707189.1 extracellular solute-binding protein [Streptomyces europaeiscabiei]
MSSFSRRHVLATGAGAALGVGAFGAAASPAAASPAGSRSTGGREETRTLDELYRAALAEGGKLVVYAGGDTPTQQDGTKAAFKARFPDIDLTLIVDYSKYQDVRVDNQFATGTLVPDVVQLQTLQDFTRWKGQGRLLHYKPAGFSKVYDRFKDPQGAWVATTALAFSFMYNTAAVGSQTPLTPRDLVDPKWKGKIASAYPHDDDAVLYLFTLYVQKYGWDWVAKFAAQDVRFARGSNTPAEAVFGGQKVIGVGTAGSAVSTSPVTFAIGAGHPFMAWGQRVAVLKQAKNSTAAKLFLNWQLSKEMQNASFNGWSVRTDITPPAGLKPMWEYPDAHVDGFPRFMEDRAAVERWKQTFALYFGEVKGDPTPGVLGLHPGA